MSAQVGAGIYTAVHANYSDSGYVDRPDGARCSSELLRAHFALAGNGFIELLYCTVICGDSVAGQCALHCAGFTLTKYAGLV